jgi:nucleotide-binding universal stress UspA family protein
LVVKKFSKILVAVDGSEPSMEASDYAVLLAKTEGDASSLIALHVIYLTTAYASWDNPLSLVTPSSIEQSLDRYKQEFQPWFDKIKEKAELNKIQLKTDIVVTPVSVVGAMIGYAEKERADLIVIGTRGRSGFKKMLLGSVASGVVKYSHCPVLAVK